MTFDFTEIQYQGKTIAQAEADWAAQFNAIAANAAGTPIVVWPIHDYGAAAWNTTTNSPTGSPYTTQMYTDFIAQAYNAGYEFVTLEDLPSRIAAAAEGARSTPRPTANDHRDGHPGPHVARLGEMALDVVNGGSQVIQNVANWYAYNSKSCSCRGTVARSRSISAPRRTRSRTSPSLPMRGDLLSVTGDGLNLSFSMIGDGQGPHRPWQVRQQTAVVTGATITSFVGNQLDLALTGLGQHDVSLRMIALAPTEVVSTVAFSADTGSSATDFVTNVAAQTISGTLSAALAAGDVVKVSLDNGATWLTATAAQEPQPSRSQASL